MEILELDEVPDLGEWGGDDGGFADGGRGGDLGCHDGEKELCFSLLWRTRILRKGLILVRQVEGEQSSYVTAIISMSIWTSLPLGYDVTG